MAVFNASGVGGAAASCAASGSAAMHSSNSVLLSSSGLRIDNPFFQKVKVCIVWIPVARLNLHLDTAFDPNTYPWLRRQGKFDSV
jgi:hypothetical protein